MARSLWLPSATLRPSSVRTTASVFPARASIARSSTRTRHTTEARTQVMQAACALNHFRGTTAPTRSSYVFPRSRSCFSSRSAINPSPDPPAQKTRAIARVFVPARNVVELGGRQCQLLGLSERSRRPALQLRHAMLHEAVDVPLDLRMRHSTEIEVRHDALHVDQLLVSGVLLQHLLRRAPGHQLDVILDGFVLTDLVEVLAHVGVSLVALGSVEMLSQHLVMVQCFAIIRRQILARKLLGAVRTLIHKAETRAERLGRLDARMKLLPKLVILLEVRGHELPGLLNDHKHAQPELGHDRHRISRCGGGKRAALERLERSRPNVTPRLLHSRTTFDIACFQSVEHKLGIFIEALQI